MSILILGGTGEAHQISASLGAEAVVSLAHQIEGRDYASPIRRGGFGGEHAQTDWMIKAGIRAVVDASHPFAVKISARTAGICAVLRLPYLRVLRPAWVPADEDRWQLVAGAADAVPLIPESASTLLAVGAAHLDDFAGLRGTVHLRSVLPVHAAPFAFRWINARPGRPSDEVGLMQACKITHLVTRNSGGPFDGKLLAARQLGIDVVMIARPPSPMLPCVETAEAAIAWAKAQ